MQQQDARKNSRRRERNNKSILKAAELDKKKEQQSCHKNSIKATIEHRDKTSADTRSKLKLKQKK